MFCDKQGEKQKGKRKTKGMNIIITTTNKTHHHITSTTLPLPAPPPPPPPPPLHHHFTTTSPPLHHHQHHQRIFITCNRFTTTTQLLTVTCLTPLLTPTWHTKEVANSFQAKENGDGGGSDVLWGDEDFLLGDER
jgi:hypothetical protein